MQHNSEQSHFHGGETQGPLLHHVYQKSNPDKQHSLHYTQYATQVFQDPKGSPKMAPPPLQTTKFHKLLQWLLTNTELKLGCKYDKTIIFTIQLSLVSKTTKKVNINAHTNWKL